MAQADVRGGALGVEERRRGVGVDGIAVVAHGGGVLARGKGGVAQAQQLGGVGRFFLRVLEEAWSWRRRRR